MSGMDYTAVTPWNKTENATTEDPMRQVDIVNPGTALDIFLDILLTISLVFSLYLFIALSCFEIKTRNLYKVSSNEKQRHLKRTNDDKYVSFKCVAVWLRMLCIFGALSTLLRCINDFLYYKTVKNTDGSCTIVKNLGVIWLVCVDTCVYMFLWMRQRVLYNKKSLRHLVEWYISVIGYLCLFLIVGIFIAHSVMLLWRKYHYVPQKKACEHVGHVVSEIIPYVWMAGSTVLHINLVFLYVYPLIKHSIAVNTARRESRCSEQNICVENRSSRSNKDKSLIKLVKRCIVISLVCVITDAVAMFLAEYAILAPELTKFRHSMYNFNAGLNVFVIVLSFKKWKQMLHPFWNAEKQSPPSTTSSKRSIARENSFVSSYLQKSRRAKSDSVEEST